MVGDGARWWTRYLHTCKEYTHAHAGLNVADTAQLVPYFSDKSKCRASSIARAVAYVVGAA